MSTSALRVLSAAVFGGLLLGLAATSRADDLDIYTNPLSLPAQAPITVLALDLNVTDPNAVGCDNVLVSAESNCQIIRDKVTTGDLLALLGLSVPVVLLPRWRCSSCANKGRVVAAASVRGPMSPSAGTPSACCSRRAAPPTPTALARTTSGLVRV